MPEWANTPPPCPHDQQYRLIRAPAFKPLRCLILADKPLGCPTHYYHGRTMPCENPLCEPCSLGIPWRWHSYLPVQVAGTNERCILELTAQATEQLGPALAEYQTLRGIVIIIQRPTKRPNGRVQISVEPGRKPETTVPPAPNIKACMAHIWGLDDRPLTTSPGKLNTDRLHTPTAGNGEPVETSNAKP